MHVARLLPAGLAALALAANVAPAQETGSIKGTFVLKGEVPKLAAPTINKDQAACGNAQNESVVVDPATKGVANVFIWLPKIDAKDIPKDLQKPAEDKVVIDNKGCQFVPHAVIARVGQKLLMLNSDPVAHNVHTSPLRGKAINDLIPPNEKTGVERPIDKPELQPIPVKCDIHPWMVANMLVVDHPYAAVSNGKGEFEIKGLPPGKYEFRVWQEAAGYVDRSLKAEVKAGEATDLGQVSVDAAKLKIAGNAAAGQAIAGK